MGQSNSKSTVKSVAFMIASCLVHIGVAAAVVSMNADSKHADSTEMEVTLNDGSATEVEISGGAQAPAVEVSQPAVAEVTTEQVAVAEIPVAKAVAAAKPSVGKVAAPAVVAAVAAPIVAEDAPIQTTDAALANEAEALDSTPAEVIAAAPVAELQDDMISEELDKVDQEQQAKLTEAKAEQAAKLAAAEEIKKQELAKEAQTLAAAQKAEEAKALQEAAEVAAAAKLAERAQAEQAAQTAANEAAAMAAAAAKASEGNGASTTASTATEIPKEVRSLSELKQKPGNPRPMYSSDDRLKGRAGEVAFLAYISKEGSPTEFKMLQSSGHRELDSKTLKALKNWKFSPGQEGWVEIPFKWDLKGGPQEMPATLRRAKVSQTN